MTPITGLLKLEKKKERKQYTSQWLPEGWGEGERDEIREIWGYLW